LWKEKIADPVQIMQMSKYPVVYDSEACFLLKTCYKKLHVKIIYVTWWRTEKLDE